MITKHKSWLLAALFVLFGMLGTQAEEQTIMNLALQHVESDYVPADASNYYRHFLTLNNPNPAYMALTLSEDQIAEGYDHFVLYRYPVLDNGGATPTPVAKLVLTPGVGEVYYEITYMNQVPRPDYDFEAVTQGTLPIVEGYVDMEYLVLVDQLQVELIDDNAWYVYHYGDEGEFDSSKVYYWCGCGYVMTLENDEEMITNSVDVPRGYGIPLFTMGNYTRSEIEDDYDMPILQAGMKNAYFECFSLGEDPEITGYTILRGDNTYPTDTISYMVRTGPERNYIEECDALPEYFGEEDYWIIARNDTALKVLGTYGDYMTYVPVTRVNGADRVKQDGDNTYGYIAVKTGVAGLDAWVTGFVHDQNADEPLMYKDDNGVDCAIFETHFDINMALPDYGSYEYEPRLVRVWVKSDNLRDFYFDDDDNLVYYPDEEMEENGCLLIWEESLDNYYWDEDLQEYVNDYTGSLSIGDNEEYPCGFGATYDTKDEGVTFVIRFYYEVLVPMPSKDSYPFYCVVEKELPWVIEPVVTGVNEMGSGNEVSKTYYNLQGIASDKPYKGLNIEVTRYSDGSSKSTKIMH